MLVQFWIQMEKSSMWIRKKKVWYQASKFETRRMTSNRHRLKRGNSETDVERKLTRIVIQRFRM